VNVHHFNRLKKLLTDTQGTIILGGEMDATDLWISPTIVGNDGLITTSLQTRLNIEKIGALNLCNISYKIFLEKLQ